MYEFLYAMVIFVGDGGDDDYYETDAEFAGVMNAMMVINLDNYQHLQIRMRGSVGSASPAIAYLIIY